jgi:hypothetical protein
LNPLAHEKRPYNHQNTAASHRKIKALRARRGKALAMKRRKRHPNRP